MTLKDVHKKPTKMKIRETNKKIIINMENFSNDESNKKDLIANGVMNKSGYKIYNKGKCHEFLLVEVHLN